MGLGAGHDMEMGAFAMPEVQGHAEEASEGSGTHGRCTAWALKHVPAAWGLGYGLGYGLHGYDSDSPVLWRRWMADQARGMDSVGGRHEHQAWSTFLSVTGVLLVVAPAVAAPCAVISGSSISVILLQCLHHLGSASSCNKQGQG